MSRDLDILVYQHILEKDNDFVSFLLSEGETEVPSLIKRYSTDINASFLVVHHLRDQGYDFSIQHPAGGQATVFFRNGVDNVVSEANSLQVAICLAALKTEGIDAYTLLPSLQTTSN